MNAIHGELPHGNTGMINAVGGLMITNGTFNQTILQGSQHGLLLLKDAASPSAFHNSGHQFDLPKCHPNTRVAVQDKVKDWIYGRIDTDAFIMWLYGGAGAGKSAIGRSIAEWCESENVLLASFFFSRTDPTRNHIKSFIATLAYSIIRYYPAARPYIEVVVNADPHIFTSSIEHQFAKLIVEPLLRLEESGVAQTHPHVIIIDGLDECLERTEQRALLRLLTLSGQRFKLGLKVLVASRPEQTILGMFNALPLKSLSCHLALSDHQDSDEDIKRFLEDKFSDIKLTHPRKAYIPPDWPSQWEIQQLVTKSSGHFIYASTAIKYIESEIHKPTARLASILNIGSSGASGASQGRDLPFSELDSLYTHILNASQVAETSVITRVLGSCILVPRMCGRSVGSAGTFGIVVDVLSIDAEEVHAILGELGSIVRVSDNVVRVLHASLEDFLFDNHRSKELWADRTAILNDITYYLLRSPDLLLLVTTWRALVTLLSETVIVTPQLIEYLGQVDLLPILDATDVSKRVIPIFFSFIVVLRMLVSGVDDGERVCEKYFSTFSKWISRELSDYLSGSHKLRALIALYFSGFKYSTYHLIRLPKTESRFDSEKLRANWVVYTHDDPRLHGLDAEIWAENQRFRARLFDRGTHASAALLCSQFLLRHPSLSSIVPFVPFLETNNRQSRKVRPWHWRMQTRRRRWRTQKKEEPQDVKEVEVVDDKPGSDYDSEEDIGKIEDWQVKRLLRLLPELLELASRSAELAYALSPLIFFGSVAFSQFAEWHKARTAMKKYISDVRPIGRSGRLGNLPASKVTPPPSMNSVLKVSKTDPSSSLKLIGAHKHLSIGSGISLLNTKMIWKPSPTNTYPEINYSADLSDVD